MTAPQAEKPWPVANYENDIALVVDRLRALADEIEREGKPYYKTGPGRYTSAARAVVNSLMWGLANAGLPRIIDSAYLADQAETAAPNRKETP